MRAKRFIIDNQYKIGVIILILTSILLAIFVFDGAYKDFGEACEMVWEYIFGSVDKPVEPPPPPPEGGGGTTIIPTNPDLFLARLTIWGYTFITGLTYQMYFAEIGSLLLKTLPILMLLIPCVIMLKVLLRKLYFKPNTNHGQQSLPLRAYLTASKYTTRPVIRYIKGVIEEIRDNKALRSILLLIWLFNLNIITILLPLIPTYLYFCISLDFKAVYEYLVFIVMGLKYIAILSGFVIIPVALYYVDKWRQKYAVHRLAGHEQYNQNILEHRDIITYKYGAMGTRKTMTLTDEALSQSVMDTNKAAELMSVCRKMFVNFDWLSFELELEEAIKCKKVYSWATCKDWVSELESKYNNGEHTLYGYDTERNSMEYNNGICIQPLFKVLSDYARLYFLYICTGSFIISNYPIREDKRMITLGNSVKWDCNFYDFKKDIKECSYYSKILNFDILRKMKTLKDWEGNSSLEFGVICIAEDDKEQTNAIETQKDSVASPYPTPKNDGVTMTEKFIRHRATVMGYCFIHIFKDGQRVMSINADTRQISTLEKMLPPSKEKNTLPFFWLENGIYRLWQRFFDDFDEDFRYYRGDETLIHYLLKQIDKKLYDLYYRRKNRYGYRMISKEVQSGTGEGDVTVIREYQDNAKVLSDRYNTATHENYFYEESKKSNIGIMDYMTYGSTTMNDYEFDSQNSYSRLNMTNPNWKKEYIDEANRQEALKKAVIAAEAAVAKKRKKEELEN